MFKRRKCPRWTFEREVYIFRFRQIPNSNMCNQCNQCIPAQFRASWKFHISTLILLRNAYYFHSFGVPVESILISIQLNEALLQQLNEVLLGRTSNTTLRILSAKGGWGTPKQSVTFWFQNFLVSKLFQFLE